MLKGKIFKLFGFIFFILGATVIFNSFQGLTGFVVYEDVDLNAAYLVGIWFILTGILLFVYKKKEHEKKGRKMKNE